MIRPSTKNKSELLFEGYLRSHGHHEFDFEPEMPCTVKHPDYRLHWNQQPILFEVKEFQADAHDFKSGFGSFDPYTPLREKINAAREKFKGLRDYCCCLVLYNRNKPLVLLDWKFVYAAMLGDLAWSVPLDQPGRPKSAMRDITTIFTSGGKMHRERDKIPVAPQNQTVSAILVLGRVALGERFFRAHVQERECREQRLLSIEERLAEVELAQHTPRDHRWRPLRVVVHENPYARIPLPPDLFLGPYDERYGELDGRIQVLYRGSELGALPADGK
jgi:hypothetical protein